MNYRTKAYERTAIRRFGTRIDGIDINTIPRIEHEYTCGSCRVRVRTEPDGSGRPTLCPDCEVRPLSDEEIERLPGEPEVVR